MERQGRRAAAHRRLGLGARHVLARAAQDLRALQQRLDTWATIHLNQIWGEVAAVRAHRNRLPTEYLADLGFCTTG